MTCWALGDDGTGGLVAVLLGGAAKAQLVLHQHGAGIVHTLEAGQGRYLGRGVNLRAADIDHHRGACGHLTARSRFGADDGACGHAGFHRLGDQDRDPQILELLLTICLHIVGDIRHSDILDATCWEALTSSWVMPL